MSESCAPPKKTRRGKRPGIELYRRMTGRVSELQQRRTAEYLLALADEIEGEERAACGLQYMAYLAASANLRVMFELLLGRDGDGDGVSYRPSMLTRDEIERLEKFWDYVQRVRSDGAPRKDALGPLARVRERPWLEELGELDETTFERYETNAARFIEEVRASETREQPNLLRNLPAFAPATPTWVDNPWVRYGGPAVAVAACVGVVIALAWPRGGAETDPRAEANVMFAADLGDGPRLILGMLDGSWSIARLDGTIELRAPAGLHLPSWVEGGTAGDVTGDGVPELLLYTSSPFESELVPGGVTVFSRDGAGAWQVLDTIPAHEGAPDPELCRRVLAVQQNPTREWVDEDLQRARQKCPQLIRAVRVDDGAVFIYQAHYGRQILRARCDASGCSYAEQLLGVESDVTTVARVRTAEGIERTVAGTGCWRENGPYAYGVIAATTAGARLLDADFLELGGRTALAAIGDGRVVAVSGTPCEKLTEQHLLAAGDEALSDARLRTVAILDVPSAGPPVVADEAAIGEPCCADVDVAVVRDRDDRPLMVMVYRGDEAPHRWQARAYDLSRPLAGQAAPVFDLAGMPDRPTLTSLADRPGHLILSGDNGSRIVRATAVDGGAALESAPWR